MQPISQQFEIAPSEETLRQFPRVMRFFPSQVTRPNWLTSEQVAQFNRDGFLQRIRIFDERQMADHRAYFDDLLQRALAAGKDSYSISTAHLSYGPVFDLLTCPTIVGCVTDLLGPDVVGWGSHYFCKLPGDGKAVDWHQDASYWPLSPTKTVTVWLAIDPTDLENGCMQFIAGSHLLGELTHETDGETDGEAGAGERARSVLGRGIRQAAELGTVVDNPLDAGEISIHADLLVHGSAANQSARRRCGLTLRYCAADVRAGLDWHRKGVVVSGSDPSGHWANPCRPTDR